MVAGFTGVVWEARPVEMMSGQLEVGTHAVPMAGAIAGWTGLSAAWVDATATLTRILAELGIGMLGANGVAAAAQFTAFTGWCGEQTAMAIGMAAKAEAHTAAYTIASLVMPTPPEVAAVDAARVAAHVSGGDLMGAGEASEAAYVEIQTRAALVMETYEAATSLMAATPATFLLPPPIAIGAGLIGGALDVAQAAQADVNPVAQAVSSAQTALANPATAGAAQQAATQVAGVAGSVVSTGAPMVGDAAQSVVSASTAGSTTVAPGMMGGAALGGGMSTGVMSFSSAGSLNIGGGAGSLEIPEGWGAGLGNLTPSTAPEIPTATTPASVGSAATQPASTRPVSTGNPLMGHQAEEEEEEFHKNELVHGEYFADGRIIASGVIGGDPNADR
ncbi:PPE family protein [Nocardia sp. NEAU-G5]|uniref:PPE family protein n=1 Tax=Nocardia albiluteola TaxID=2842303 RepID=A0ABS6ARL6_9NOCA|nr:PPE domain-containing protein [Nocardia albiluteola]MBU3060181.1 PPE family protein [Nocardia albiluteola]